MDIWEAQEMLEDISKSGLEACACGNTEEVFEGVCFNCEREREEFEELSRIHGEASRELREKEGENDQ